MSPPKRHSLTGSPSGLFVFQGVGVRHVTGHTFRTEAPSGALRRTGATRRPTLAFVVPTHGRVELAAICLRQLRRTCAALTNAGIDATAIVVGDDENLDTAAGLGFGTIVRSNEFTSAKFNDGIQAALDPHLANPPADGHSYLVVGPRRFRGHTKGATFTARLDKHAAARAIARGDIQRLGSVPVTFTDYTPPKNWDVKPADYVVPCGSDDWVDHRLFLNLPKPHQILGFQWAAFVSEDGDTIVSRHLAYEGGVGIRVYPRQVLAETCYRPADEERARGCDTSILVNVKRSFAGGVPPQVIYGDLHEWQIVDWKTSGQQLNSFDEILARHGRGTKPQPPRDVLQGVFPSVALKEMERHYAGLFTTSNQYEEVQ